MTLLQDTLRNFHAANNFLFYSYSSFHQFLFIVALFTAFIIYLLGVVFYYQKSLIVKNKKINRKNGAVIKYFNCVYFVRKNIVK